MTLEKLVHPKVLLRLEGVAAFGLAVIAYAAIGKSWWLFALLFLAPDIALLGYLANQRVLARSYNVVHSYLLPAGVFALGFLLGRGTVMATALIWIAHIGVDRAVGFGLKYADAPPKDTHLGRV